MSHADYDEIDETEDPIDEPDTDDDTPVEIDSVVSLRHLRARPKKLILRMLKRLP